MPQAAVSLVPGSYDARAGTFTAVAASAAPVPRNGLAGQFYEVLSMDANAVRLDRFRTRRAPLLDSHRANSVADQIGVITGARLEAGKLVIDARLSDRDDERMRQVRADLASGIIRNVSIGYKRFKFREAEDLDGSTVVTVTDWEPYEVSLVALPADPNAHIRSLTGETMPTRNQNLESEFSADPQGDGERRSNTASMSIADVLEATRLATRHDLSLDAVERHVRGGGTLDEFRSVVLNHAAARADATRINNLLPALGTEDAGATRPNIVGGDNQSLSNPQFLRQAISDALYTRMGGPKPVSEASQELLGQPIVELGVLYTETVTGERCHARTPDARIEWGFRSFGEGRSIDGEGWIYGSRAGSHTTSDFPQLLLSAGHRVLQDKYAAAASPLKALARQRTVPDFRPATLHRLSEMPRLELLTEKGEYTHGSRSEEKEVFKLGTYGRIFSISRRALINDDLHAFSDALSDWAGAAAETENELLVALFTANSGDGVALDDGVPVYATTRGNKAAAGGAISITTLSAARQAFRETKSLDGVTPLRIAPKHLVVGPAKETEAEQVLAAIAAAQVSNANPFSGKLTLHVEPSFTGNAWRLFADPGAAPIILIAYLEGAAGPDLRTREGWETDGFEYRARLDFGCGAVGWRGTYLNPGN